MTELIDLARCVCEAAVGITGGSCRELGGGYSCWWNDGGSVENRNKRNSREALLKRMLIGVDLACLSEAWRTLFELLCFVSDERESSWRSVETIRISCCCWVSTL